MPSRRENPRSVFLQLPRKSLKNFKVNERGASESIAEFHARCLITEEETAWVQRQPVSGEPSLRRLSTGLSCEGFTDIRLHLNENRNRLEFRVRLTGRVRADDSESLLRLWIQVFRAAGFRVGFSEVGITNVDGPVMAGLTLTAPIDELAEHGAPTIELD